MTAASDITRLTINQARQAIARRDVSVGELNEAILSKIKKENPDLNAYISVFEEEVLERARHIDADPTGQTGKLSGIPIAIKDTILTRNRRTTACSKILENFIPPYSAHVIERLEAEGAIIIGKTNCDEFAMGSSNENSAFGTVKNPWDKTRIPGGSSGGSAVAVRADMCLGALGTDTGGSIRQPASHTGCVGIKPSYGRVSRYGAIAFASSLDQVGPLAKSVADGALLLEVIAGKDERDSTSVDLPVSDYSKNLTVSFKDLTIGVPKEYLSEGLDSEIASAVRAAIDVFKREGARIVDISLPHTKYAVAVYYLIATAEASANLARYDGVKYGHRARETKSLLDMVCRTRTDGFGKEVKRRIMLGTFALSSGYYDAYYRKAQTVRTLMKEDFLNAFKMCDCIVGPTAPTAAFKIGEKIDDPLQMYLSDIYTISTNLAGAFGIVVPCGFTSGGLPIGLQIMSAPFREETGLRAAYSFEQATEWHKRRPPS